MTTVVVGHDLDLAAAHSGDLVYSARGEVVADGTPQRCSGGTCCVRCYEVDLEVRQDGSNGRPFVVPL